MYRDTGKSFACADLVQNRYKNMHSRDHRVLLSEMVPEDNVSLKMVLIASQGMDIITFQQKTEVIQSASV